MIEQDLAPTIQELMTKMAQTRTELDTLKGPGQILTQPEQQMKSPVSTTRRTALHRMAMGLLTRAGR